MIEFPAVPTRGELLAGKRAPAHYRCTASVEKAVREFARLNGCAPAKAVEELVVAGLILGAKMTKAPVNAQGV